MIVYLILGLRWGLCAGPPPPSTPVLDWATHPENAWVRLSPREGLPISRCCREGSGAYDPEHRAWIPQSYQGLYSGERPPERWRESRG